MAEDNQGKSEKTEDPTPRRLEEARKEGRVPTSRELVSFSIILTFTLAISFAIKPIAAQFQNNAAKYFVNFYLIDVNALSIMGIVQNIIFIALLLASIPLLVCVLVIIMTYVAQHNGLVFSTKSLRFDLSKVSPLNGFKRIFSMRSIVELIKGLIKISIVAVAAYFSIKHLLRDIQFSFLLDVDGVISLSLKATITMMAVICAVMFIIAILDFIYQKFEYIKELKMSIRDIKDEQKSTEGDPEIKSKQKSKRFSLLKKFNIKDVALADVVITNPTHYAIALEYDPKQMPAPKIIAKGTDLIAKKIKDIAYQNFIPVIENPPLARALFDLSEIGDFVPLEYYKAVAEVISYVMKIRPNKKLLKEFSKLKQQ